MRNLIEPKQKRNIRGYKITDKNYQAAMKRATKKKVHLANIVEDLVVAYAEGSDLLIRDAAGEVAKTIK